MEVMMSSYGLQVGTPEIRSVGSVTFGPDDVLFVADNESAVVFAIDVADPGTDAVDTEPFDLDDLDTRLASYLGCSREDLRICDMAVHPRTHHVYLSVMRGQGDAGVPVIVRIDVLDGSLSEINLENVAFSAAAITNAPTEDDPRISVELPDGKEGEEIEIAGRKLRIWRRPARTATVTDMSYVDRALLVAGMSNEEFASNLRRIPFPFTGEMSDNSLEIFHVSHGKWETAAPIKTFVPYESGRSILASYTCTPVVHFPIEDFTAGTKATGRTVAELGAMNQPLDMVSFNQDDAEYLLVSNSSHGLIKIDCRDIDAQNALTEPGQPIGVPRQVEPLTGVSQLANLNGKYVLALQKDDNGARHLRSLKTASL
jgi:hypothetical protein